MILSDRDVNKYVQKGKIIVKPTLKSEDIRPTGIRLHLADELLVPKGNQIIELDGSGEDPQYEKVTIPSEGYILKPSDFVLGSTLECFQVSRDIVCHIDGRSTVARLGLAIHCTSSIADGNFEEPRTVVLEIKNVGPFNLVLKPNTAVGLLTFSELSSEIEQNTQTQYKGQQGVVAPNLKGQKQ